MDQKKEKAAKRLIITMSKNNLRQQDLADKTGISKSAISHYSNGKRIPDIESARKIAKVLSVTPEFLMCEDDADYMIVDKTELQKLIAQMDTDMIEKVTAYAQAVVDMKNSKGEQIR